ncbi:hypothetical protein [Endozoicomonas ascidiicola]|uniref:hypothetical protein n=1 Tax=Endozoicomonas ascidiicola TaxID=1698521 RepID=UPI000833BD72|nr:hypothetical protein [Endozoicomonas ascidiicola]
MRIPYENKTEKAQHLGSVTVPPGETRMVESSYILARTNQEDRQDAPKSSSAETVWSLEEFVKQNQAEEIKQLPELTNEQFAAVVEHYQTNKPPKKLEAALPVEAEARKAQAEADEFAATLKAMSDEELQGELMAHAEDEGRLAMIQHELSVRGEADSDGQE